ncbi:hypothetical protein QCA50_019156 [Cerrena zonata]|uniref:MYND-type domain-containing protein n=1 Tax=Cerrena zonata TaxID=2478898 RepID=A0AAW0FI68_9APHY
MSVWSQIELQNGENMNPARDMSGAWTGARIIMNNAAMDITREGGKDIPFVTYFDNGSERLLVMEILDVKECPWPEPGKKLMELIKTCQETKFGHPASGPLVPMMQTPTFPLVIVRYSYMEGRPEGGSQFLSHLQDKLAKMMPKNTTVKKVREKLQWHLTTGEEMGAAHLQMLARILSFNAELVDKDYVDEIQSHWNGISKDVASESKISFFVPCLRLRFRALEQIETGITPNPERICAACGKSTESKLMCGSCTSVYYCSAACNKANWPEHKSVCKFSKNLFKNPPTNLKPGKFYVPARTFLDFIIDNGFAVDQEGVKMSGLAPIGDCPPNEYGDERFILKATRPLDYTVNGMAKGLTIILFDRRRSIQMRTGPGDVMFAEKTKLASGPIPFDVQGHQNLVKLMIEKGLYGQLIYLWAKRIGDCVELDLEDLPNQKVDF